MFPAELRWEPTATGAMVKLGQLGLLIVRKVNIDYEIAVLGRALQNRSITLDDGKLRAEAAARRWVQQAAQILWTKEEPAKAVEIPHNRARPGGQKRRSTP